MFEQKHDAAGLWFENVDLGWCWCKNIVMMRKIMGRN